MGAGSDPVSAAPRAAPAVPRARLSADVGWDLDRRKGAIRRSFFFYKKSRCAPFFHRRG